MTSRDIVHRPAGEGPVHTILGMNHRYLLLASESAGHFMTFVVDVPPGCGAPMHRHDRDSEAFFMLEGEITAMHQDGSSTVIGEGDFVWFGPGHAHSFANASDVPARALIIQAPGVEAECFFNGVSSAQARADFTPERDVAEIGARHGVRVLQPA